MNKRVLVLILVLSLLLLVGCGKKEPIKETKRDKVPIELVEDEEPVVVDPEEVIVIELDVDEKYTSKDEVAFYIKTFEKLPKNYISSEDAATLGWDVSRGDLWDVTDEMSIGGDIYENDNSLLPIKDGRIYYDCDTNYEGGYRGAEKLVYSNDGLIYSTVDNYNTFNLLYGVI